MPPVKHNFLNCPKKITENEPQSILHPNQQPQVLSISPLPSHNYYPKKWAKTLSFQDNELLSSWITRVMHANFTNITSQLWLKGFRPYDIDWDLDWNLVLIDFIEQKTGISKQILKKKSLIREKINIHEICDDHRNCFQRFMDIWFTDWSPRYKNGIKYCPLCLANDKIPFFRKEWRFGYHTICSKHDCYLENSCPHCGSNIAYYRLSDEQSLDICYKCKKSLTERSPNFVQKSDSLKPYVKRFSQMENLEVKYQIISLAWFISNYVGINDPIFGNHPISNKLEIKILWKEYTSKANRIPLFRQREYTYLLIGTASKILFDDQSSFWAIYHTSKAYFWRKKPLFCKDCNYHTSSYSRILRHCLHQKENYACRYCYRIFKDEKSLEQHESKNKSKLFQCIVCNQNFSNKEKLKNHMEYHSIVRMFICPICGKIVSDQSSLTIHKRIHSQKKLFECKFCEKAFKTKGTLKIHLRTHTGERPYICSICGTKFKQSSTLKAHTRIHTGERPYICNICYKGFRTSTLLKQHKQTHLKVKPEKCDICGKRLSSRKSLRRHLRIHSREKPFECQICGKKFRTHPGLSRHKKIHSDERPFKCTYCGKTYKRKDHLKRHRKKHV